MNCSGSTLGLPTIDLFVELLHTQLSNDLFPLVGAIKFPEATDLPVSTSGFFLTTSLTSKHGL